VGPLTDGNVVLVNNNKKTGDLLNTYFALVFTNEDTEHLPLVKQVFPGDESECLSSFTITSITVKAKLNMLKMNEAPGIDSEPRSDPSHVTAPYKLSFYYYYYYYYLFCWY